MTRALVLGATGHIGAHVVRALLRRGYTVRAGYRSPQHLEVLDGLPIERTQADCDDPRQLRDALDGCPLVVHCAGYYPAPTHRRNAAVARGLDQSRRVCEMLRQARTLERIVYVSSAATVPLTEGEPATEADQEPWPLPSWRPLYATVKIAMEHAMLRAAETLPAVIVNPSICIGEYDARAFSGRLVLLFATGRLPWVFEHGFNVVYTGDVAEACVSALERGRPGERYILSGENLTLAQWATLVAAEAGVTPPRWHAPLAAVVAVAGLIEAATRLAGREPPISARTIARGHRQHHWMDCGKADRELSMPHTPTVEAIRRTIAWSRQHGRLAPAAGGPAPARDRVV